MRAYWKWIGIFFVVSNQICQGYCYTYKEDGITGIIGLAFQVPQPMTDLTALVDNALF